LRSPRYNRFGLALGVCHALVNQLNQKLDQIEAEARWGISASQLLLVRFPNNASLIGLFTTLNNALFFVDNFRRQIQTTVEKISLTNVSVETVQEAGEDLSEFLGLVLDAKIMVSRTIAILEDLQ